MHELVRAEVVRIVDLRAVGILSRIANPEIRAARPFAARADAIVPVVAISETPTRPTQPAGLELPHLFDQGASNAADVGDLGFLAYPNTVVNYAAQVFDEVAINFRSDSSNRLVDKHFNVSVGGSGRARRQQRRARN